MTKTARILLSHYSSTKWGEGERGDYSRGVAYFKFRPIGGALIRRVTVSLDYKVTWLCRVTKLRYLDKNLQGEDTSEEIVEIVENLSEIQNDGAYG